MLLEIKYRTHERIVIVETNLTYGNWLEIYLKAYRQNGIKKTSYRQLELIRDKIPLQLRCTEITKIFPFVLQQFVNEFCLAASESYANKMMNLIRSSFRKAYENDLVPRNPASDLKKPHRPKKIIDCLTIKETEIILDFAKQYPYSDFAQSMHKRSRFLIAAAVITLLWTGLRRGELLGLEYDDVDLKSHVLHIRRGVFLENGKPVVIEGEAKTEASIGDIALPDVVYRVIMTIPRVGEYIFGAENGKLMYPRNFNRLYDSFLKALQKQYPSFRHITPHISRHTAATLTLRSGADVRIVQKKLRHSSIYTTMRYTHPDIQDLIEAEKIILIS